MSYVSVGIPSALLSFGTISWESVSSNMHICHGNRGISHPSKVELQIQRILYMWTEVVAKTDVETVLIAFLARAHGFCDETSNLDKTW